MSTLDWTPMPEFPPPATDDLAERTLSPEQKKAIRSYREWNLALLASGTALHLIVQKVANGIHKPEAKAALLASGHALYDAMAQTQKTLYALQQSVKNGTAPARPMPPIQLDPWNPDDKPESSFDLIWGVLQPALVAAYQEWGGDNTVGAVLYTVIEAGGQVAKDFKTYFPKA